MTRTQTEKQRKLIEVEKSFTGINRDLEVGLKDASI